MKKQWIDPALEVISIMETNGKNSKKDKPKNKKLYKGNESDSESDSDSMEISFYSGHIACDSGHYK